MSIRARLNLSIAAALALTVVMSGLLLAELLRVTRVVNDNQQVNALTRHSILLHSLTYDFLEAPSERAGAQWHTTYQNLNQLLLKLQQDENGITRIPANVVSNYANIKETFELATAKARRLGLFDQGQRLGLDEREDQLAAMLLKKNQELYDWVLGASAASNARLLAVMRRDSVWMVTLLLLVAGVMAATLYLLKKAIVTGLSRLHEGVATITQGDLQHRLATEGPAEFARLSTAFNTMTAELQALYEKLAVKSRDLTASEQRYRSIFENAVEGLYQSTTEGRFLTANPALARMCGYASPADLMARVQNIPQQLYADPSKREELVRQLEMNGVAQAFECQFKRGDGGHAWVSLNARVLRDAQGHTVGYEGSVIDITKRRELEEQFRQSQKLEAFGQLAGGVAHDFNNILAATLMNLAFLKEDPALTHEMRETVEELEREANQAANLTKQLLLFSRRQVMQPKPMDLNKTVGELLKMLKRLLGEHIDLTFKGAGTPVWIHADASMMEQVVMNLAVNARDAMPQGGLLTVGTGSVRFTEETAHNHPEARPGSFAHLMVSDTGCGMSQEVIKRIFEPFFTTKDVGKGTGLGLATVYGIVKQHQGWIEVESEPDKGSCFHIYLPEWTHQPASSSRGEAEAVPGGSETILVVEDDPAVQRVTTVTLERCGYQVLTAGNGPEALTIWAQRRDDISLLLTDMVMPKGLSGLDLARRFKHEKSSLMVIIASGYDGDMLQGGMPQEPWIIFLPKPYPPKALAVLVRKCLDQK